MDRNKIFKMVAILAAIVVIAGALTRIRKKDSMSLTDYAALNGIPAQSLEQDSSGAASDEDPALSAGPSESPGENGASAEPSGGPGENGSATDPSERPGGSGSAANPSRHPGESGSVANPSGRPGENEPTPSGLPWESEASSRLTGASLNGESQLEHRVTLEEGFYYEPISDNLRRFMTGISYPAASEEDGGAEPEITFEELAYVHILHYDFDGRPAEGELICNTAIAQDLAEIFQELYRNEYRLEKVLLIEEYDGDDTASMEDNNTSCFNYRPVEGSDHLSKHAYGLAVDINPLYNPYITYTADGEENVSPVSAQAYADRSRNFSYKIDSEDLCYRLFIQHGFTWGGNWNNVKDYQHFQKAN